MTELSKQCRELAERSPLHKELLNLAEVADSSDPNAIHLIQSLHTITNSDDPVQLAVLLWEL